MSEQGDHSVTECLEEIRAGDAGAKERLTNLVLGEMHLAAVRLMRRERRGHTLQPTALVNEALLRFMNTKSLEGVTDGNHLMAAATLALKRVLVDHARTRGAQKRGGDRARVPLNEVEPVVSTAPRRPEDVLPEETSQALDALLAWYKQDGPEIVALDEALEEMRQLDQRWFDVVLLRHFGGFTIEKTAEIIGVSYRTVASDWNRARAWLRVRLGDFDE